MVTAIMSNTRDKSDEQIQPHTERTRARPTHSASVQWLDDEDSVSASDDSDGQLTPRASLVASYRLKEVAEHSVGISRDDTAADLNCLPGPSQLKPQASEPAVSDAAAFETERSARLGFQRQARHTLFDRIPSSNSIASSSSLSVQIQPAPSRAGQTKAASLGRRFSRKFKMADFRENFHRHTTTMPSRIRRASTPMGAERPIVVAPISPSKRNSKQCDSRPRKLRSGFGLSLGDRKDTPAPPSFGKSSDAAAQPTPPASAAWSVGGGDGARKAVAAYKALMQPQTDGFWSDLDDLHARRARVGSLSSAADSGADLSTYGGSQCLDGDGDIDMRDPNSVAQVISARNFLSVLPHEICLSIFEHLDAKTLLRTERVCQSWRMLCSETSVWRAAFFGEFERRIYTNPPPIQVGGVGVGRPNRPQQEWKKMYKARSELETNWRMGSDRAGKAVYLSGHTDSVYCLQFDEEKIITGSRDRTIRVWDINTFQCLRVIGSPNVKPVLGPKCLRTVDYPAFHIATASVNGTAYGDGIYHTPSQWHDASILCLQYDESILVTGSSDSDLLIWDIKTYQPIKRLHKHTGGVLDVALDAKHIVSCSKDSRIIVWDRKTLEPRGDLIGHRGPVNAVQLRGKYLVSASGDGIARLWDIEQMKLIKEFSAKERGLAAVEFSEDMKYVLAGGNDHITYKFETDTGREVQQFTGHTQLVRSLWLDSANNRVVSGSYDYDLRVYDFSSGQEIWRAEEWTTSWMLAAKSDYRRIVATSQDGRILIVDFGLHRGGRNDGLKIDNLELLRGTDYSSAIEWRDPWKS